MITSTLRTTVKGHAMLLQMMVMMCVALSGTLRASSSMVIFVISWEMFARSEADRLVILS